MINHPTALCDWFRPFDSVLVAFSGGLDSSVVAKAAAIALPQKATAVFIASPSGTEQEIGEAHTVAAAIPIELVIFPCNELESPDYVKNQSDRCYHCKKFRFQAMAKIAAEKNLSCIVDGSQADDLSDFRPGFRAVKELNVRSPLAELGFDKNTVRELARHWKLPNAEMLPSPCLSTRLAFGLPITEKRLRTVEQAEMILASLGFSQFRVRLHSDELVRIEVPTDQLPLLTDQNNRDKIVKALRTFGFRYVTADLEGFRSGSFNP